MEFKFEVLETIARRVIYVIEADSEEEALEMAENGETVAEENRGEEAVLDRSIVR